MVRLFLADVPRRIVEIEEALKQGNAKRDGRGPFPQRFGGLLGRLACPPRPRSVWKNWRHEGRLSEAGQAFALLRQELAELASAATRDVLENHELLAACGTAAAGA